jgi:hypothetical protein
MPRPTLIVVDASANESEKIKYSKDEKYDKITTLNAIVTVIEGIDLYDHV